MRLSAFILENMETILQEWEDFARDLGAVTEFMDAKALRDHAKHILRDVAVDLETEQTDEEQEAKSKGQGPSSHDEAANSGAEEHGIVRAMEGFTLDQMVSEYRALRASVLRLWTKKGGIDTSSEAEQVTRFNESIDEALARSVKKYASDVERLIAAAHGKERMAALGTLSAGLGHDMSNVLMPMRVSLEKLEQANLPPESQPMLDALRRAMDHLRGLTRGLRSLSVDPEDADASPSTTHLHAWWAEATSPYKWALSPEVKLHANGLQSITLSTLPPVAVPKHVLMQSVFNLIQNASEALSTKAGGNIWVSAKVTDDGKTVSLTVRDDGPGMSPEILARCTEPFFTTKPRGRGTGLGLSLARTALERHGGRLQIESTPGQGSSFTLVLPRSTRRIARPSPGQGSSFTLVLPVARPTDKPREVRHAILTVADARVRAIIVALLAGAGVEATVHHHTADTPVGNESEFRGAFLWVADQSVNPAEVLRFLQDGGPDVRVVVLGKWMPMDPGSQGETAAHDGHLITIAGSPTHAALQGALRRAVIGWAP